MAKELHFAILGLFMVKQAIMFFKYLPSLHLQKSALLMKGAFVFFQKVDWQAEEVFCLVIEKQVNFNQQ